MSTFKHLLYMALDLAAWTGLYLMILSLPIHFTIGLFQP